MDDLPIINAFKHMQIPLMIIGQTGEILHCNSACHRLFGHDSDDLVGRPVSELLSGASLAELSAQIKPPAIDAIIRNIVGHSKTGTLIPLVIQLTAWADAEQGVQHALALRDASNEVEGAGETKDELKRVNNAVKGARIGVFEYNPVADTVIVSDIWRELMELAPTDAVDVQVEWRGRVHPDDLEKALEPVRICQESIAEHASCEYRMHSKDRSQWRWVRTDISISKRDRQGRVTRIIGAMTDITERKTIEKQLRISVAQFRSAFDSATAGMAIVGVDGAFQRVNPAFCDILGYSKEELFQTDFQTLTHPDDLDADLRKFEQLKAGSIPAYQMEKRYIRANGAVIWALLSVGIVRDADGRPDHFISQISDVTELRRLSELKDEFVATVSHELRTPLTSVLGSLSLLSMMDEEPFSDEAQRLLFIAQENGKRLHALVNDILDFEKFSARQMRFTLSRKRILDLIDEAILANLGSANLYGVRFNVVAPDLSLIGYLDAKRFHQVMTNLLSNAAKFATKGNTIDVTVESQEDSVKISIANDGDGIPEDFRSHIFKPFSQALSSTKSSKGGTGLGLSITKQIVEQTGGTIGFDSTPGGRTTFWFTVPVEDPD
jgi:PAS domain S-box-containing protein